MIVALLGGVALGAAGLAVATTEPVGGHRGPSLERIQHLVLGALDSLGATAAQESKVHDIIAANFGEAAPDPEERERALALLRAPTIDRAAVEKLRVEMVANFDAKSKIIASAVLDIAAELTPEQRAKLLDRVEEMAQRNPIDGSPRRAHGGRTSERCDRSDGDPPDED